MDIEKYLNQIIEADKHFKAGEKAISDCSIEYCFEQVIDCYRSLFKRFAPFAVGDDVILKKTPNFDSAPGWCHCKHFLKAGAKGCITKVGYMNDKFTCSVVFYDESWISSIDGSVNIYEEEDRHGFHFNEDWVSLIKENPSD